ncbi:hypothetical protein CONPUDRAFT_133709 [Coniophora puteana RWD-64-598 SS2]|uniref:Uncharacterized protein n=1 Tax=Coniophora puteana (strain RWD-64-598) TaxID=741705 RepID=A0A5M3N469_CONPW|nr:uncharacterized protein CONPUDRAFT_133709 [Coniophora puteana RWD-64-598 SS2]EIW86183.1 hypothetical protein CONPUDRAFT_133709 [Coniophora puteana RWD-64-598 SS2]
MSPVCRHDDHPVHDPNRLNDSDVTCPPFRYCKPSDDMWLCWPDLPVPKPVLSIRPRRRLIIKAHLLEYSETISADVPGA